MREIVTCRGKLTECVERQTCYAADVGMGQYCGGTFTFTEDEEVTENKDKEN
jgi:hypothetical protein